MAILAGDALLTEAFNVLASGPEPVRGSLCRELAVAAGAAGMVGGQVLDIAEDRPAQIDYLSRMHSLKTGALIRAACRMGVLAAGGSAEDLQRADTYGDSIGLAFQIADDILDVIEHRREDGQARAGGRGGGPAHVPGGDWPGGLVDAGRAQGGGRRGRRGAAGG